jgi:hypothetical protein
VYKVRKLIKEKHLPAYKDTGRWYVNREDLEKFAARNATQIKKLKEEYLKLYRQGAGPEYLQTCVSSDFIKHGIQLTPIKGFAEQTIYNKLMEEKKNGNHNDNHR